jgi:hypothetical protein
MNQNSTLTNCLSRKRTITACLFVIMMMISLQVEAQATKEYTSAEADVLITDMNAGTYDVYILATSGIDGEYVLNGTTSGMIVLNKNVTIKAKTGLASRPKVRISGTSTSSTAGVLIPSVPSMFLRIEGIEFNGTNMGTGGVHHLVRSATGTGITATTASQDFQLIVRDCFFHDFGEAATNKGIFRMEGLGSSVDIQGSFFNNCVGRLICLQSVAVSPYAEYGDIVLKNNTFSNLPNDAVNGNGIVTFRSANTGTQLAKGNNFTVDHCTFYNCKFFAGSDLFNFRTMKGLISITNSIFDQVSNGLTFVNPDLSAPAPVNNFNYLAGFGTATTGTNTITTAPVYTDASTLNFALTNRDQLVGSDALTAGNTSYYGVPTAISEIFLKAEFNDNQIVVYPNPVSETMRVEYSLTFNSNVQLDLYSINNKVVSSLINNEPHTAGTYSKSFNVSGLKPGIYFARLVAGRNSKSVKVLVSR